MVICDIYVPDRLKPNFAEFTAIFKNVEVTNEDVGQYMQNLCENLNEFKTPRRSLIGSYFGKQIMLATPLLKWYLKHGLIINNITAFVQYDPIPVFREFAEKVAATRRKADCDEAGSAVGNTAKLIGKLFFFFK